MAGAFWSALGAGLSSVGPAMEMRRQRERELWERQLAMQQEQRAQALYELQKQQLANAQQQQEQTRWMGLIENAPEERRMFDPNSALVRGMPAALRELYTRPTTIQGPEGGPGLPSVELLQPQSVRERTALISQQAAAQRTAAQADSRMAVERLRAQAAMEREKMRNATRQDEIDIARQRAETADFLADAMVQHYIQQGASYENRGGGNTMSPIMAMILANPNMFGGAGGNAGAVQELLKSMQPRSNTIPPFQMPQRRRYAPAPQAAPQGAPQEAPPSAENQQVIEAMEPVPLPLGPDGPDWVNIQPGRLYTAGGKIVTLIGDKKLVVMQEIPPPTGYTPPAQGQTPPAQGQAAPAAAAPAAGMPSAGARVGSALPLPIMPDGKRIDKIRLVVGQAYRMGDKSVRVWNGTTFDAPVR